MGTRIFIDETKAKSYVVVAAVCPEASLVKARHTIGGLVLPGQRSIHMKHESPRRRSQIASAIADLGGSGVSVVVLDAGRGPEPEYERRDRALRAVVERAVGESPVHIILDLDRTLVSRDARSIAGAVRDLAGPSLTYSHHSLASEPLLAIPDVVAWCWARGGGWLRRITPVISSVVVV